MDTIGGGGDSHPMFGLTHSSNSPLLSPALLQFNYPLIHSLARAPTHSRTRSLTHLLAHPPTHSLAHSLTHSLAHSALLQLTHSAFPSPALALLSPIL